MKIKLILAAGSVALLSACSTNHGTNAALPTTPVKTAPPPFERSAAGTTGVTKKIDRTKRTNPYASKTFTEKTGGSRYGTSQGWSRGRGHYWWGRRGSDIPTTRY